MCSRNRVYGLKKMKTMNKVEQRSDCWSQRRIAKICLGAIVEN